jgi:diguanylate cyclase (GGDEF)-like protein
MTSDALKFRAALSRLVVAVMALVALPTLYPSTRGHLWIWGAYLVIASFEQVLIHKQLGGRARPLVSGLIDTALLTYTVHRLGSTSTPFVSVYFFASVANALVVEFRVGIALGLLSALAYDAVVLAEQARWIPFAPDVPRVAVLGPPPAELAFAAAGVLTTFLIGSTVTVSLLVRIVHRREEDLTLANARLEELSQRDPLTELFNRRYLFERIEIELARVRRGHPLAVVMIDLDGFKKVNDTQGHLRGDVLLKEIGAALPTTTRASDVAGRYGGDEFLLVLPDTDVEQAHSVAQRVAYSVREAAARFDRANRVTASLGVAIADPADTVTTLLRRADTNAYRAKQQGGDRVVA